MALALFNNPLCTHKRLFLISIHFPWFSSCLSISRYVLARCQHFNLLSSLLVRLLHTQDDTSKSSSTANELGLANVGGVFVVLMGGMGIACVIAVCEFVWKSRKVAVEEKVKLREKSKNDRNFLVGIPKIVVENCLGVWESDWIESYSKCQSHSTAFVCHSDVCNSS